MNLLPALDARRNYGLDILRAIGILTVLLTHAAMFVPDRFRAIYQWLLLDGVAIFFVFSGFLIGGILIRTLESSPATPQTLWRFWLMRWFRTLPPYFFALLLIISLVYHSEVIQAILGHKRLFLFLQNFAWPIQPFYTESWSLAVEEWFYLFLGASALVFTRLFGKPKVALLLAAALFISLSTGLRLNQYLRTPPADFVTWDRYFRSIVVLRLDSLMYGVLAALWARYATGSWQAFSWQKCVIGTLLLFVCVLPSSNSSFGAFQSVWSFSLTGLGTMLTIPYLTRIERGSGALYRFLTYTSLTSYSMYLLNGSVVIGMIILPLLKTFKLVGWQYYIVGYVGFFVVTYLVSILMYQTVEVTSLRLRKRLIH